MCKLTKNLPIQGGLLDFQNSGWRICQGEGKNSGGLRPLLELCFGTSEIECSASWSYII